MSDPKWKGKISHHAQLGGIETAVIDNGPGRGVRIAWINTGTGLRYKVVIDRAMDIMDAFYNQHNLSWLSCTGITPPAPFSDKGIEWLRTFGGGLITTCGLSHVGGPDKDAFGERSLHGRISNAPAEIISIIQPDPAMGKLEMSITGIIREATALGPNLILKRTISGVLGEAGIQVKDEVINRGNTPMPHMLLYHMNFGWPIVDEGVRIIWNGSWTSRDEKSSEIFREGNDFYTCPPPLASHAGTGEAAAYIDVAADADGTCTCGVYNPALNMAVAIKFRKKELPWLTNWQHWGEGEYIMGLEPGTNPPIGQKAAREQGTLRQLAPGEQCNYHLDIRILTDQQAINKFLNDTTNVN